MIEHAAIEITDPGPRTETADVDKGPESGAAPLQVATESAPGGEISPQLREMMSKLLLHALGSRPASFAFELRPHQDQVTMTICRLPFQDKEKESETIDILSPQGLLDYVLRSLSQRATAGIQDETPGAAHSAASTDVQPVIQGAPRLSVFGIGEHPAPHQELRCRPGEPIPWTIGLDLREMKMVPEVRLSYTLTLYAKQLGVKTRTRIAESCGEVTAGTVRTLAAVTAPLPSGTFVVDAVATFRMRHSDGRTHPAPFLAFAERQILVC